MSPIRHQPPGHGWGKLIWALYSGLPRDPGCSSCGWIYSGQIILALALSVWNPGMLCWLTIVWNDDMNQASKCTLDSMPVMPAASSSVAIAPPSSIDARHTSGSTFGLMGSYFGGIVIRAP